MGAQETNIYRLGMKNKGYEDYFPFLIFWAAFGGKMGVASWLLMAWGLKTQPKSWSTGWTFWPTVISKI